MRPRFFLATALALAGAPLAGATVRAQSPATAADTTTPKGPVLTLDQAISLALKNNPAHLQTVDNQGPAAAQLRSAYAGLLPSASARLSGSYQKQGVSPQFGTTLGAAADVVTSNYFLGVNYNLSASTFLQPKAAKAGVNAAREDIASSAQNVRN
ncbi:MAG TPA: TolC family protein, partial [Gemmatimonadaceae bacterium]|nr:TolC family protein [Gemmatimonadaceae bacterium]